MLGSEATEPLGQSTEVEICKAPLALELLQKKDAIPYIDIVLVPVTAVNTLTSKHCLVSRGLTFFTFERAWDGDELETVDEWKIPAFTVLTFVIVAAAALCAIINAIVIAQNKEVLTIRVHFSMPKSFLLKQNIPWISI